MKEVRPPPQPRPLCGPHDRREEERQKNEARADLKYSSSDSSVYVCFAIYVEGSARPQSWRLSTHTQFGKWDE